MPRRRDEGKNARLPETSPGALSSLVPPREAGRYSTLPDGPVAHEPLTTRPTAWHSRPVPLIEGEVTIVLAGAWNRAIFTPDWVRQKLFADDDDLVVEVLFGEISGLRFLSEGVALVVLPGRVQISPVQNDDESLARAERVATDLLAALPETPMQARGINVVIREPVADIYATLFRDPPSIPATDLPTIEARRVGWQFREGGDQINVQAELGPDGVSIAFNFHRSGKTAEVLGASIASTVRSSILRTRDITRWMGAIPVEATT